MSFLDDVINTTKTVAATAGKKTDEAVQLSKLKLKAVQVNSEIKGKYEKLGALIYQMAKSDEKHNEEFDLIIADIDDCYAKLAEIEEKTDELKQEISCPVCGVKTKNDNAYCPKCGEKLPVKPQPAEEAKEADEAQEAEEAAPDEENKDNEEE